MKTLGKPTYGYACISPAGERQCDYEKVNLSAEELCEIVHPSPDQEVWTCPKCGSGPADYHTWFHSSGWQVIG